MSITEVDQDDVLIQEFLLVTDHEQEKVLIVSGKLSIRHMPQYTTFRSLHCGKVCLSICLCMSVSLDYLGDCAIPPKLLSPRLSNFMIWSIIIIMTFTLALKFRLLTRSTHSIISNSNSSTFLC